MIFTSFRAVAASLEKFNKARLKVYLTAVRTVARDIAKAAKKKAAAYHVVQKIRQHNRNIKVMVVPSARYFPDKGQIVGKVKSTGLLAKIEKGMQARKFWNNRGGKATTWKGWAKKKTAGTKLRSAIFKGPQGWRTIHQKAGGQTFKKVDFVKMTPSQEAALVAAINRVNALAAKENF